MYVPEGEPLHKEEFWRSVDGIIINVSPVEIKLEGVLVKNFPDCYMKSAVVRCTANGNDFGWAYLFEDVNLDEGCPLFGWSLNKGIARKIDILREKFLRYLMDRYSETHWRERIDTGDKMSFCIKIEENDLKWV